LESLRLSGEHLYKLLRILYPPVVGRSKGDTRPASTVGGGYLAWYIQNLGRDKAKKNKKEEFLFVTSSTKWNKKKINIDALLLATDNNKKHSNDSFILDRSVLSEINLKH